MEILKDSKNQEAQGTVRSFSQWRIANPWMRVGAQAMDQGMVAALTFGSLAFLFPHKIGQANWIVAGFFLWILVSVIGQGLFISIYKNTPGKKILGVTLQSARPQHQISFFQALMRSFVWWLGLFSFGAGWMTILSRPDRRAWHDLVADTTVVTDQSEFSFITPLQKKMGETWIGLMALFFVAVLTTIFAYEFAQLKTTMESSSAHSALERESWLLLAGGPSYAIFESPVSDTDAPLKELMLLFTKARQLSVSQRADFFKTQMAQTEESLCPHGSLKSMPCESAQAMEQLLSEEALRIVHPPAHLLALPGLQILEQMESLTKVSKQIHFLTEQTLKFHSGSLEYLALKTAQARLLMKSGEFRAAKETLDADIKSIEGKPVAPEDRFFDQTLTEVSCEAQALDGCRFDPASSCAGEKYWQEWTSGCQLQKKPLQYSSGAQALGFWWGQVQVTRHFENLDDWQAVKKIFETDNTRDFEKYVFKALDAVLEARSKTPSDLMGKAKEISPENPLWGWAQTQLLREFGTQWAYLVPAADQKLINKFNLKEKITGRTVANDSTSP